MDFTSINALSPGRDDIEFLLQNSHYAGAREKLQEILKVNRDSDVLRQIFECYVTESSQSRTRATIRDLIVKTEDTELIELFCRFIADSPRGGIAL